MNREQYLEKAIEELSDYIGKAGYTMPTVKVSTGWPTKSAFKREGRCLGECWHKDNLNQDASHIFLSPYMSKTVEVLGVLVHELGHAILPKEAKHKKTFKQYMRDVDLTGKATATVTGEVLTSYLNLVIERIGQYPHESIDKPLVDKKQTTRLRLWVCPGCDLKLRTANDDLRVQCLNCDLEFIKQEKGEKE